MAIKRKSLKSKGSTWFLGMVWTSLVGVCLLAAVGAAGWPTLSSKAQSAAERAQDLARGLELFDQGKLKASAQVLQALVEKDPADAETAWRLVRVLLEEDRTDDALAVAANAAGDVRQAWGQLALAEVRYRQGTFRQARRHYEAALEIDPKLARAHLGLGRVLRSEGLLRSAKEQFQNAFELDPDDPEIVLAWHSCQPSNAESDALLERYLALPGYKRPTSQRSIQNQLGLLRQLGQRKTFWLADVPASVTLKLLPKVNPVARRRAFRNELPMPVEGFVIKARFNGGKERKLLVDTGAGGVLLASGIARKDKLKQLNETFVTGVGDEGPREGYAMLAETMTFDGLEFRNCVVETLDKDHVGDGIDGIIGTGVFSSFLIRLDLPDRELQLTSHPAGPCQPTCWEKDWGASKEGESLFQIHVIRGKIVVEGLVNDSETGQFVIDTGATNNLLSSRLAARLDIGSAAPGKVRGISGAVSNLRRISETTLQLGGVRQLNRDLYAFDMTPLSHALGFEVMGLVGNPLLKHLSITIDYRRARLKFEP